MLAQDYKAIIFDVDGVLIDVRKTYHEAIKKTVLLFTKKELSKEDLLFIKQKIGINNDWEASTALILLKEGFLTQEELSNKKENLSSLRKEIIKNPFVPYKEVQQNFEKIFDDIKENEELIFEREMLEALKEKFDLGILTGRPSYDLFYSLDKFGIKDLFKSFICEDSIKEISLRKPHPFSLKTAIKELDKENEKVIYLGDTKADFYMTKMYQENYGDNVQYIHCNFYGEDTLKEENIIKINSPQELFQLLKI